MKNIKAKGQVTKANNRSNFEWYHNMSKEDIELHKEMTLRLKCRLLKTIEKV